MEEDRSARGEHGHPLFPERENKREPLECNQKCRRMLHMTMETSRWHVPLYPDMLHSNPTAVHPIPPQCNIICISGYNTNTAFTAQVPMPSSY